MEIEKICENKAVELLGRYFVENTGAQESIGEYTLELPHKIEGEYRAFLEELWPKYAPVELKDKPLVLEEQELRRLMTESSCERLAEAHEAAATRTLWERLTHSNHEDVAHYKALLEEYTRELLTVMRLDFLEEVTGRHIRNKSFEVD